MVRYSNPGTKGYYLTVTRSTHGTGATCVGDVDAFTGREAVHSHTLSAMYSYYMIELNRGITVKPSAYKLRSYGSGGGHMVLNWCFQASVDGENWVTLKRHDNDTTISNFGDIGTWYVNGNDFFTYFRVMLTGAEKRGMYHLCLSGFELYGELRREATRSRNAAAAAPSALSGKNLLPSSLCVPPTA